MLNCTPHCSAKGKDNHPLMADGSIGSAALPPPPLMKDSGARFTPHRLTRDERKARIQRYLMKKDKRNFSKKIKYACRKTLADSRPRVRGRFASRADDPNEEAAAKDGSPGWHVDFEGEEEVLFKEEDMLDFELLAFINDVDPYTNSMKEYWC